jgi:superfamily II DNA or RNA helicase
MDHQRIEQVIIVVSTRGIGEGFKLEATKNGLTIDWIENGKGTSKISGSDSDGFITTYAAVASMPLLYALKVGQKPTMIIFDEFHHMGENSVWGDSCLLAFGAAKKRIFITGTAWRSDGTPIPFVDYLDRYVRSDYSYDWDQAWADKIIRRVSFYEIDADVEVGGEFIKLSEVTPDNVTDCFRSLYNSKSDWCRKTFELANADLMERRRIRPNAAGLIIVFGN